MPKIYLKQSLNLHIFMLKKRHKDPVGFQTLEKVEAIINKCLYSKFYKLKGASYLIEKN